MPKTLIIYQYFEKNQTYKDNLAHFLAFGFSEENDYIIAVAGHCSADLPIASNITYVQVPNHNMDFGSFANVLSKELHLKKYQNVIFLNCSVRGPFMPSYLEVKQWTAPFIAGLSKDVGLFGASICEIDSGHKFHLLASQKYPHSNSFPHVQTYVYAMQVPTLEKLLAIGFYQERETLTRHDMIVEYELSLSQEIMKMGKSIGCLLSEYQVDYRLGESAKNPATLTGDPLHTGELFGRTPHPFEVIMAKTERDLYGDTLDLLTHALAADSRNVSFQSSIFVQEYLARVQQTTSRVSHHVLQNAKVSYERNLKSKRPSLRKRIGHLKRWVIAKLQKN